MRRCCVVTPSSSPPDSTALERAGRAGPLALIVAAIAVATAVALVILWPGEGDTDLAAGLAAPTERAEVTEVAEGPCPPPQPGTCGRASIRIESGADEGAQASLALGATALNPGLEVGDAIRVSRAAPPAPGATSPSYSFVDFERRSPMLWLALAFAALVIAFGRLRGALSLIGLAASLAVVVLFVIPAILDGTSPLAVAIVGSLAVMLLTISLAHGLGPKSLAAMLGTTLSLVLVAVLALAFTEISHLTGLASEESALLQINEVEVSFEGLLLAGMVIAALGVLDDVTVSQASTVLALRRADPGLGFGELYRRAIDVGRDHVSATVNTLVLAYVGASLPVLLLFGSGELGFVDAVNVELVAQEVVATLVGSIGLIAAVPITTALAARLAPASGQAGDEHGHHH
jgi:uncharacterized membrane protein